MSDTYNYTYQLPYRTMSMRLCEYGYRRTNSISYEYHIVIKSTLKLFNKIMLTFFSYILKLGSIDYRLLYIVCPTVEPGQGG